MNKKRVVETIKKGGLAIYKTDTLYGIQTSAWDRQAVEKIYDVKQRAENKPFIILITHIGQLKEFDVEVSDRAYHLLKKYWPGKLTVILRCSKPERYDHLTRRGDTLAFRVPKDKDLFEIIAQCGPLVSTTANLSGHDPAVTIDQAKKYFGDLIDYYDDSGTVRSDPSTIVDCSTNDIKLVRKGSVKLSPLDIDVNTDIIKK